MNLGDIAALVIFGIPFAIIMWAFTFMVCRIMWKAMK